MRVFCFFTLLLLVGGWFQLRGQQPPKSTVPSQTSPEVNATLMETTFKVAGPAKEAGKTAFGTAFLIVKVMMDADPPVGRWTVVTAAHVLRDIVGDYAILQMRRETSEGKFVRSPCKVLVRSNGKDRFTVHPKADVAAFYISLPKPHPKRALNTLWLATDDVLKELEIHPGDELLSLGYPLGAEANDLGFPILRSGKIASYPIVPMGTHQLLFDFNVFGGNSGGPVYFSYADRFVMKDHNPFQRRREQKLLGLVSQQLSSIATGTAQRLGLSVIVPAPFITETLNMLPPTEQFIECESLP